MFDSPIYTVAAFLAGACIGSFLNVVIYRVPLNMSVNEPRRSFCPACKTAIKWYHNLPIFSWLFLRGKCAYCKKRISVRYWLVELLTALLFTSLWIYYPEPSTLLLFAWCAIAIVVSFIDAERMYVFPAHILAGIVMALGAVCLNPELIGQYSWQDGLLHGVLGACAGFVLLYLVVQFGKLVFGKKEYIFEDKVNWHLRDPETDQDELTLVLGDEEIEWSFLFSRPTDKLILKDATLVVDDGETLTGEIIFTETRVACGEKIFHLEQAASVSGSAGQATIPREAMGSGDPFILAMICALTGWQSIPVILLAACLTGILVSIIQRLGFGARLPFGPMLFAGAFFWIFYGRYLWEEYLALFTVL